VVNIINDDLTIIPTSRHIGIEAVDKGNTVVVMLEGASSEVVALLMPREAAREMARAIGDYVEQSPGRTSGHSED
jgi:hypothetical protein